jgi:TolB-like protein/Tfp pilus assembly protein PilF
MRRLTGLTAGTEIDSDSAAATSESPDTTRVDPSDDNAAVGRGPSIAVLPFENMSDDSEQAHLADGMTEDIITSLAAMPHLEVTARNTTFAYKGQAPDLRDVGRRLGVRYALEGSVRRVGDKLRVTAQLIETEGGNHLWAEKYDRPYEEIFRVQDELVSDIASALSLEITRAEVQRGRTVPPSKLEAWELITHATHSHFRQSPARDGNREMIEAARKAVEIDKDYAYARAAYSWMLASSAVNGWSTDVGGTIKEAHLQLDAAKRLDVTDSLSRYYVGAAHLYLGEFEKAVRFLKRSLEENPHQPDTIVHLGLALGFCGQLDEALQCFERASRLGTQESRGGFYSWYKGQVLCLFDRYAEAIPIIEDCIDHFGNYQTPKIYLSVAYEMIGESEKASAIMQRACTLDPTLNPIGLAGLMGAHFDPEKGQQRVAAFRKHWPGVGR